MTKKMRIEESIKALEKLVEEIESDEIGLEESIDKFKQGLTLAKKVKKQLNSIESEVKVLNQDYADIENEKA